MPSTRLVYVVALMLQHVSTAKGHFHGSGISCMKGNLFRLNCVYNWDLTLKKFVLYFVHETRSTAPDAYAVFHLLRQDTTVQSTDILKQSFIVFDFTFILFCIILYKLHDRALCVKSDF